MSTTIDLPATWRRNLMTTPGSFSSEATPQGKVVKLTWHGPMADSRAFEDACLFKPRTIDMGGGIFITRVEPLVCPWDDRLYANHVGDLRPYRGYRRGELVSTDPFAPGAQPLWPEVASSVTFEVPPFATTGESPYFSVSVDSNPTFYTIPNYAYTLIDEAGAFIEPVAQDVSVPIAIERLTFTWHEVTDLPGLFGMTQPIMNTVNLNAITLPDLGLACAPGTLHVGGRNAAKTITFGGGAKAQFSLGCVWREVDWNRALASKTPHTGIFRRVSGGTGVWPLRYADQAVLTRGY